MHQILWPVCALALLTAGCDNHGSVRITTTSTSDGKGVLKVVDSLQCPQDQGVLIRKGSASADGRSCVYSGPRGAEVTLHLVSLDGRSSQAALKPFETSLSSSLPEALAKAEASKARADAEAARADADAARADAEAARAEAQGAMRGDSAQVRAPGVAIDAQGDKASVRLPGMRIDADGDRANIKIGGITIRADDSNSRVNVTSSQGDVLVNADDSGARVVANAPGEAVRATFLMTAADPAANGGWRMVAYEARGPAGGPIVVATVRTKERNENRVLDAAKALVKLNVGD